MSASVVPGPGYGPGFGTCPDCGGRGEVPVGEEPPTNRGPSWQPWEPDWQLCTACLGSGLRWVAE